jgi:hypothetical protein
MVASATGGGRSALWPGLAVFALLVLAVHLDVTVRRTDRALLTFDSAEFAIAGRHLARTGTLATEVVLPDEIRNRPPPVPLLVGHPLVPILDALAFRIGGENPALTLIPPALAYLATVLLAAALALRLTDSHAAAWCAGAAVALAPQLLYFASEGLSELPFAACCLGALHLLRAPPERPRWPAFGLLLGLGHLARPIMVPLLPAWLAGVVLAAPPGRRGRAVLMTLAGFLPFAAGLALYKWSAAGNPFADVARFNLLIGLAPEFEAIRVHRMLAPPEPLAWLASHPRAVAAKLARELPRMSASALFSVGVVPGLLALSALVWPPRKPFEPALRVVVLALFGLAIVLVTLALPSGRYFVPLLPVLLALAVAGTHRLAGALRLPAPLRAAACAALVCVIAAYPIARTWKWTWSERIRDRGEFTESVWRSFGARLRRELPAGGMVASDVSAWVCWYADRPAVLIPTSPAALDSLARRVPIGALVLTNEWLLRQRGEEAWLGLYAGSAPPRTAWRRHAVIHAGGLRAVVFVPASAPIPVSP